MEAKKQNKTFNNKGRPCSLLMDTFLQQKIITIGKLIHKASMIPIELNYLFRQNGNKTFIKVHQSFHPKSVVYAMIRSSRPHVLNSGQN